MERVPIGTALRVAFRAFLAADHVTPATGKTIAITISKNGAAFGNPNAGATNATGIANGWYYVDLNTTDTGTAGPLLVRGTEASIDDVADAYRIIHDGIYYGSVTSTSTTTTLIDTALTQVDNHWNGRLVVFLTGTLTKQIGIITSFTASSDTLNFTTAFTSAPQSGDLYAIY